MYDLDGDTAIVTGAAQGIGRAIAERLGEDGANVVLADVQAGKATEVAEALGENGVVAEAVECDVTDPSSAEALADHVSERFGSVDVLVNNAGGGGGGTFTDLDAEEWQRVVNLNLGGAYNCSSSVVPGMIERGDGRIVNIASMAGRNVSVNGNANYTAAKWGVIGLTKHMARDLAPDVRVNAVCPGGTLTPLLEENMTDEVRDRVAERVPLGRWGRPEDQANAAAFLASEQSAYMTGTLLEVDGGGQLT